MSECISTPVSWLVLEQYALGELPAAREEIGSHLAACPACAACLARIEADAKLELRPLPVPLVTGAGATRSARRLRFAAIGSGLALAAAAVLAIGRWQPAVDPRTDGEGVRVKGDAIAFTLVRDDETIFAEAGGTFRGGDRFKALVTCPPGSRAHFDLVVYDSSGPSFPLAPAPSLACGNEVPLAGAFRITGGESVKVCLVWSDGALDRGELARTSYDDAAKRGACKQLTVSP
ncbi:MAG: hypothetical protein JWM74_699 [Myxococcaceae bacterium]|nr:hypothetical protein [Myxococcaceae bacterium]